jgi:glycosyltransferase involved in cell wall biosynthesis
VSTNPAVTVVVPTRNRREMAVVTVRDALRQRDVDLEVIVVDDGSRDGTGAALLALGDDRLQILSHSRSLGQAVARDNGLAAARGEWVAFLDDDDRWAPVKLRRQLDAAARADADFVYTDAVIADTDGRVQDYLRAPNADTLRGYIRRHNAIPAGSSNVLARTDLLRRVGGFDPALTHLADWDLWIRLTEAGRPAMCPEPLVAYILHGQNIHLQQSDILREARHLDAKHRSSSLPGRVDRAALHAWAGWAHLRRDRPLSAARHYLLAAVRSGRSGYLPAVASALLQHLRLRTPAARGHTSPDWLLNGDQVAAGCGRPATMSE